MIGFPNRVDAATLSNGSWLSSLPLSNLQSRILGKVARSTDATNASTKLDIDLGSGKKVRLVCLINHNISISGRYRVRGGSDNTFVTTSYDSGWNDVWPVVFPWPILDWTDDNWWSGKYTAEEIAGFTTALVVILPYDIVAEYWRIEIDDTTNAAGYVQAGRIFIGPALSPTYAHVFGSSVGWETKTDVQEAIGGAEYFQRRAPYRVSKVNFAGLTEDEGMSLAFELDRRAGIDQEVFWIHDIADTVHALRRRFLARIRQLDQIEFPYPNNMTRAYELKELL
jgi:hypothetical protein